MLNLNGLKTLPEILNIFRRPSARPLLFRIDRNRRSTENDFPKFVTVIIIFLLQWWARTEEDLLALPKVGHRKHKRRYNVQNEVNRDKT